MPQPLHTFQYGGFRRLRSFALARATYDGTVIFCNRFISGYSRTHDQMVQAARSEVQNIAEGSLSAAISKRTEIRLTGVARASLGELILDYEDYLRQHGLQKWEREDPRTQGMIARLSGKALQGQTGRKQDTVSTGSPTDEPLRAAISAISTAKPEVCANILLCLASLASYFLSRQLKRLESDYQRLQPRNPPTRH